MISFFDDTEFRQIVEEQGVALPDKPLDASLESFKGYQDALDALQPHIAKMREKSLSMAEILSAEERTRYYTLADAHDKVEYLASVVAFAQNTGQIDKLKEKFKYLEEYGTGDTVVHIRKDFAPMSFSFMMYRKDKETGDPKPWFNGGMIYHGPHDNGGDGSAPTFSVNLSPTDGWSIHT